MRHCSHSLNLHENLHKLSSTASMKFHTQDTFHLYTDVILEKFHSSFCFEPPVMIHSRDTCKFTCKNSGLVLGPRLRYPISCSCFSLLNTSISCIKCRVFNLFSSKMFKLLHPKKLQFNLHSRGGKFRSRK